MTYKEYIALVDAELPQLQPSLPHQSPPEVLKLVAIHLFFHNITKGALADATRKHLNILWTKGVHGFGAESAELTADDPLVEESGMTPAPPGEKSGFNRSEFI